MKSTWKWFLIAVGLLIIGLAGLYLMFNVESRDLDQDARKSAPGELILLPAGEVHYRLVGPDDGPVIVLIHGFSVPSYVWDPTLLGLEEAGYRVLAYDLFGRGYSERLDGDYDISLFTKQLDELLHGLGINEPVVLGGLSMGGPIAASFTRQHPERVSGLILIAPEVIRPTSGDIFPLNLPLIGEYLMGAIMEPFILPGLQAADFVHPEQYPDWEDRYRVQLQFKGTGKALLSTVRNLTENDPIEEYRPLNGTGIPLLLIWGSEDQTITRDQIDVLQELLPEIQTELVPEAGHLPHYEQPGIVNPVMIEFIGEVLGSKD